MGRLRPGRAGGERRRRRGGVGAQQRLPVRRAPAAQRLPGVDPLSRPSTVAPGRPRLGQQGIKRLGPGDFSTPAPSLAAGGEVLNEDEYWFSFLKARAHRCAVKSLPRNPRTGWSIFAHFQRRNDCPTLGIPSTGFISPRNDDCFLIWIR